MKLGGMAESAEKSGSAPPRSLQRRVSASVVRVFLISVPCAVVALFGFSVYTAQLSIERETQRLESFIHAALTPALWDLDGERVASICTTVAADWNVASFSVSDDRRALFSFSQPGAVGWLSGRLRSARLERNGVFVGAATYRVDFRPYLRWATESAALVGVALLSLLAIVLAVLRKAILSELREPIEDIAQLVSAFGSTGNAKPSRDMLRYAEFSGLRELLARMGATISAQISELEASLNERNELTREINHRVKNNLQLLAAIIDQQAENAAQDKRALTNLLGRIDAIAYAYDQLLSAKRLNGVHMDEYLADIAGNVASTPRFHGIRVVSSLEPLYFSLDYAMNCGLIAYELITNAAEHAYGADGGEVELILRRDGDRAVLSVGDTGAGCGAGYDSPPSSGLGFRFVEALVEQLDAEIVLEGGGGCRFSISFPAEAAEAGSAKALFSS